MPAVLRALPLAFAELADASARRALVSSVLATVALLVGLVVLAGRLIAGMAWFGIGWIDGLIDALGAFAAVLVAWLLFPVVLAALTALWSETIARAVEARCYPGLGPARPRAALDSLVAGLRLAGAALGLNLVLLPLYVLVPGVNLAVFYALNGYLVARGYFEPAALRRLDPAAMRALFGRRRFALWLAGVIITFMTTVPILNLVVPIVATALMVHLFEDLRRR